MGVVKVAIAGLYLAAAFFWSMPPGLPLQSTVVAVAAPVFKSLGLWQSWDMFAPDPMSEDVRVSLFAELADGTALERDLSNMEALGPLEKYSSERWRRFCNDHLRLDVNRDLWPGVARWFAARLERETGQPVNRLVLWRHWRPTLPPPPAGEPPWEAEWTRMPFHDSAAEP